MNEFIDYKIDKYEEMNESMSKQLIIIFLINLNKLMKQRVSSLEFESMNT